MVNGLMDMISAPRCKKHGDSLADSLGILPAMLSGGK